MFNIQTNTFQEQTQKGDVPIQEQDQNSSPKAIIIQDTMYIFGGDDENEEVQNMFYSLDLNSMTWSKLINDHTPQPRRNHTLVAVNNKLCVLVGYT